MEYSVPGFIKITDTDDLNNLESPIDYIRNNQDIYLRKNGIMIYLGRYREVKHAAGMGGSSIVGIDGAYYGEISDPAINDNLFILDNRPRIPFPPSRDNIIIPSLYSLSNLSLCTNDYPVLRAREMPPPNKIIYSSDSDSTQYVGKSRSKKNSRSKKSRRSKKNSRSKKNRSKKSSRR
jgi:hypothetical protein